MANRWISRSRYIPVMVAWFGTFVICALAIMYFFDLHWAEPLDSFRSIHEQVFAILRTDLIATLLSSWAIWLGAKGTHKLGMILIRTGLATQLSLTLYGMAGCGGVFGGDSRLAHLIFPSTFFSEFNFLTVIFEVAPVTSIAASLLLYGSLRIFRADDASVDPAAEQKVTQRR